MSNLDNQLERIAGMIANLTAATEKNTQDISQLQTSIQSLANIVTQQQGNQEQLQRNQEQHQRNFDEAMIELRRQGVDIKEMQVEIRGLQVEIRGLQTENRRILDRLINREDP